MDENITVERWLERSIELAIGNVGNGGGPFGAVIVRGGEVIAEGVNRVTATCDPTAHAEMVAIRRAGQALNDFSLSGCDIYASCEPCPMCLGAILWARLDRVWFAATKADAAAAGFDDASFYQQFTVNTANVRVPVRSVSIPRAGEPFHVWKQFSDKVPY